MSHRTSVLVFLFFLVGCPASPTPPAPSDAAPPTPSVDAAAASRAGAASASCVAACAALQAAGCVTLDDCAVALTSQLGAGLVRNPVTGKALTCDDVAQIKTAADALALGQPCGSSTPHPAPAASHHP